MVVVFVRGGASHVEVPSQKPGAIDGGGYCGELSQEERFVRREDRRVDIDEGQGTPVSVHREARREGEIPRRSGHVREYIRIPRGEDSTRGPIRVFGSTRGDASGEKRSFLRVGQAFQLGFLQGSDRRPLRHKL